MPRQSAASLEEDIRRIIRILPPEKEKYTLKCNIHGTASGISAAFVAALDRLDQTGRSSERLHILVARLGEIIARSRASEVRRVDICIAGEEILFHYPEHGSESGA